MTVYEGLELLKHLIAEGKGGNTIVVFKGYEDVEPGSFVPVSSVVTWENGHEVRFQYAGFKRKVYEVPLDIDEPD